jgi:hypothetical protein
MVTNEKIQLWWDSLEPETRRRLAREPGTVPLDLWDEVTQAGALAVGGWWPEAQAGPHAAHLTTDVAQFIEDDNERLLHDLELQSALHEASTTQASIPLDERTEPDRHANHLEELRAEAEARGLEMPRQMRRP